MNKGIKFILAFTMGISVLLQSTYDVNAAKFDDNDIIDKLTVEQKKLQMILDGDKDVNDYRFAIVDDKSKADKVSSQTKSEVEAQELEDNKNYYLVIISSDHVRQTLSFDTIAPTIQDVKVEYVKENHTYIKATVTVTGEDIVSYTIIHPDPTKNIEQSTNVFKDIVDQQYSKIRVSDEFGNTAEKTLNLLALGTSVVVPTVKLDPKNGYTQKLKATITKVSGYRYAMKKETDTNDFSFSTTNAFEITENGTYIFAIKNETNEVVETLTQEITTIDNVAPTFQEPAYTLENDVITIHATDILQPRGLEYQMDGGVYQTSSQFPFGTNEEHIFKVKDKSGNESQELFVDKKPPIFQQNPIMTKIGSEINGYVKSVEVQIFADDGASTDQLRYALQRVGDPKPTIDDYGEKGNQTITVHKSGTYYAYVMDRGGNIAKSEEIVIDIIDNIVPTIEVNAKAIFNENSEYANEQGFQYSMIADDQQSGIDPNGYAFQKLTGSEDIETLLKTINYQSTSQYTITQNGKYLFAVKDLLGNMNYKVVDVTKIDTTLPTVSTAKIDYFTTVTNSILYGLGFTPYASSKVDVIIPITDDLSGVNDQTCFLEIYNQDNQLLKKHSPYKIEGSQYTYSIDITDTLLTLKLNYSDKVNNQNVITVCYLNNSEDMQLPILLERDAPIVMNERIGTSVQTISQKDWITKNTTLTYTLSDIISSSKTCSGLAKVRLSVNGKSKLFTIDQTKKVEKQVISLRTNDYQAHQDGSFDIVIELEDNAGNHSRFHRTIYLDDEKPKLTVSYDNNDADTQYTDIYKANRTATLKIKEMNFDSQLIHMTVSEDGVITQITPQWTLISGQPGTVSAEYQTQVTFDNNVDYQFRVSGKDLVGYTLEKTINDQFTIDKMKPTLNVSYDNNYAINQNYYAAKRIATLTIVEHNFDPQRLRVLGTASDHGTTITYPKITSWKHTGDHHTAVLSFDRDAHYTVDFSYQDKAGNQIKDFSKEDFYIDMTAPKIEIRNIQKNSAYAGKIEPMITLSDTNYDKNGVSIKYSGARRGQLKFDGSIQNSVAGETYHFKNLKNKKDNDDIYSIHVSIKDKAGNSSESNITYSVNRFGSTYKMSPSLETLLLAKYTSENQDIVFDEMNVNKLTNREVKLGINGQVQTLKPSDDYTVNESFERYWNKYTYRLDKSLFENDGVYQIMTTTKDSAGHINENIIETKKAGIVFTVDKTKPTIAILDLDANGIYNEKEKQVKLVVEDNIILDKIEVYLNGQMLQTENHNFNPTLFIPESNTIQTLKIVAYDKAGNMETKEIKSFTVSTNILLRWFINKPLFFGSIIGTGGIIGSGYAFMKKKRFYKKQTR